jgi:hypothetical protein
MSYRGTQTQSGHGVQVDPNLIEIEMQKDTIAELREEKEELRVGLQSIVDDYEFCKIAFKEEPQRTGVYYETAQRLLSGTGLLDEPIQGLTSSSVNGDAL